MYAIIKTGGKQHKVEIGRWVDVEKLPQAEGEAVTFDQVLLVADGDKVQVGAGLKAVVTGKVVKHGRGEKIVIYKMRPKKHYRRRHGHRQSFTRVMIEGIKA